ncbi:exostosin domain-containing protein [Psychroserpens mesophilus]|uniref:exostosin domain-containing protein n=1 Tax=Psychroserpens mesophilus TaxID=325473 RepID=UPI003D647ED4
MNIYIPDIDFNTVEKRHLFIATRPFFLGSAWGNDTDLKKSWGINTTYNYTNNISDAQVMFLPKPINYYQKKELQQTDELCKQHNLLCYGFIIGDCSTIFPFFDRLMYFRVGGFKGQLPKNNIGLPVALSDIYNSLYEGKAFEIRAKQKLPTIGFCGHANLSAKKKWKDKLGFVKKNVLRFIKNPFNASYEPLFSSAYERFKLLKTLENSSLIKTNFIYRNEYRAGANTKKVRKQTNKEYYENIRESDYILCVRGAGNFSVRLYETLMMGRIPVFVDTNCLLPFEEELNWKKHLVWVPWKRRHEISKIVSDFHNNLNHQEFNELQHSNRLLWENSLSIVGIFEYIRKKTITN